jgi:alanyl aminopeptidase
VIGFLARAKEPRVLQEANRLGLAYAGLEDGRFHPEAVDADLAQEVLGVAVEQGGAAIFDGLVVRLATTDDGDLRRRILFALARAADPERSARALRLSLDPRLRKQEVIRSLLFASLDERTRDAAWGFTRDNLDQLLRLLPAPGAGFLPFVARRFCEAQRAEEVRRSLEPRTGQVDGLAQNLRQAVESIRLCAAQAEAQRGSAERFFAARAGTASPR